MVQFKNLPKNPNPGFMGSDNNFSEYWYLNETGKATTALHKLWGQQPL
jgi:hypothetical protein